jgi:hypothetical protein
MGANTNRAGANNGGVRIGGTGGASGIAVTSRASTIRAWLLVSSLFGVAVLSTVRCTFFDRKLHSRMPLDPTHVCKRTCV